MFGVDECERDPDAARAINVDGPAFLARAAERIGAAMVHFSSNYVFDGKEERCYTFDDDPAPINVYGQTKAALVRIDDSLSDLGSDKSHILLAVVYQDDEGHSFCGFVNHVLSALGPDPDPAWQQAVDYAKAHDLSLPNTWLMGQAAGVAVDRQDHIWVVQRPKSLTEDERGATVNPPRSLCCASEWLARSRCLRQSA